MSEAHVVDHNGADFMGGDGHAQPVPQSSTLSGFVYEAACRDGIEIRSLAKGTVLNVRTLNSQYRLIVLENDEVVVQGGALFPKAVSARLQGASTGGSLVRIGWIEVGLRMELCVGTERVVTSSVDSIVIESLPPQMPAAQYA